MQTEREETEALRAQAEEDHDHAVAVGGLLCWRKPLGRLIEDCTCFSAIICFLFLMSL